MPAASARRPDSLPPLPMVSPNPQCLSIPLVWADHSIDRPHIRCDPHHMYSPALRRPPSERVMRTRSTVGRSAPCRPRPCRLSRYQPNRHDRATAAELRSPTKTLQLPRSPMRYTSPMNAFSAVKIEYGQPSTTPLSPPSSSTLRPLSLTPLHPLPPRTRLSAQNTAQPTTAATPNVAITATYLHRLTSTFSRPTSPLEVNSL